MTTAIRLIVAAAAVMTVKRVAILAQPDRAPAAFEVASIRQHQTSAIRNGPLTVSSPLIRLEGYTVFGLVMDAYDLKDYQLRFGAVASSEEIYGAMYDIVARVPGDTYLASARSAVCSGLCSPIDSNWLCIAKTGKCRSMLS